MKTVFCSQDQYVFLNQCALDIIMSRIGTNMEIIYENIVATNIYGNMTLPVKETYNGQMGH